MRAFKGRPHWKASPAIGRGVLCAVLTLAAAIGEGRPMIAQAASGPSLKPATGALRVLKSNPYYFEDPLGRLS